jgi:hypothetical protein
LSGNLQKLIDAEAKEQYQVKNLKQSEALENVDDNVDLRRT